MKPLQVRFPSIGIAVSLFSISVGSVFALAQEVTSRPPDQRAAVTRHLDMEYSMPSYPTKEEWLARKEALRIQILVAAGLWPMPQKCPLNARVFGRIERDGYTIEKVYFESYPGFYVTGNLYRPRGKSGPFPGVLCPHGHWAYGRIQDSESCSVPARCITLARLGFIAFSYDMVGYNDSRQVEHRIQAEREALWGFGSLGLQLWNSIRSLDFLEGMPDIDRSRIACTGASGGGTQTFLLSAVDDRIQFSVPVNMISAHMQGGCVCENAPNLRIDTNNMEIGALMAPRPMLLVSATGDWTKNTLEVEFPAIQRIYKLLGAEERLSAVRVNAGHNYNKESREHVYRWLGRWVMGDRALETFQEKGYRVEYPSEVLVFYGRDLPQPMKKQQDIAEDFIHSAELAVTSLRPLDDKGLERFRAAFGPSLRYSLMAYFPDPAVVDTVAVQSLRLPSHRELRFCLTRRGKDDSVPATLWLPGEKANVRQAVLLVHPRGAEAFEDSGKPGSLVQSLVRQGISVLAPDVFNTGRARFQRSESRRYFTTYNRTDDANRIQDVLTSLAYLRSQVQTNPIKVAGFGEAGLWCIMARALAEDDASFAADFAGFQAGLDEAYLRTFNIPGIRRAGDFRSALVLSLRSPLWVAGAGDGFPLEWARGVYSALGKADLLRVDPQPLEETSLLEWLGIQGSRRRR